MTQAITNHVRKKNDISVYFCGGTGADIAAIYKEQAAKLTQDDQTNVGNIIPYLVDTSISNLTNAHSDMQSFQLRKNGQAMDGGGKIMSDVFDTARLQAPDALNALTPGQFSIVVANMGGGSGSAISVALLSELLTQGKNVVVIAIAATESKTVLDNTTRTTMLYQSISEKLGKSVVIFPFNSDGAESFEATNKLVAMTILMLGTLMSNNNARLDTADLAHWINFDRPTKNEPALVGMYYTTGDLPLPDGVTPYTVATLTSSISQNARPGWKPEYQAHGILPAENSSIFPSTPVHFAVADGIVDKLHVHISNEAKALARAKAGRPQASRLSHADIDMDGMSV